MTTLVLLSALIAADTPADFPDQAKAFVLTLSREDFAAAMRVWQSLAEG